MMFRSGAVWQRWVGVSIFDAIVGTFSVSTFFAIVVVIVMFVPHNSFGLSSEREFVAEQYVRSVPSGSSTKNLSKSDIRQKGTRLLFDVYLDEDRPLVREDVLEVLETSVEVIKHDPASTLIIESYCDQRGSGAYSLALGHRRGWQIREFVQNLGIHQSHIQSVSFGKEGPQCHGIVNSCWEEHARTQLTFRYVAISKPKLGCLGRVRIHGSSVELAKVQRSQFLQKIRLAPPRKRIQ